MVLFLCNKICIKIKEANMEEYLLLLGADQFLRERSYAGGKSIRDFQIWTAIKGSKYKYNAYFDFVLMQTP